jgi:UDP-glucose 4-epimerase
MVTSEYYQRVPLEQVKYHIKLLNQLENAPHYVFVSSAAVYGNCQFPYPDENSSLKPLSPYAHGKALAEEFLLSMGAEYPGGITIIRATSIFAESLNGRIFGRIRSSLARKEDFQLFGDGSEMRDFLHASDFFNLMDSAIQNSLRYKGAHVYNIGSGNPISTQTLLELAMKATANQSNELSVTFNGAVRVGDPHTIAVSTKKIDDLVGTPISNPISRIQDYFLYNPEDPEHRI